MFIILGKTSTWVVALVSLHNSVFLIELWGDVKMSLLQSNMINEGQ